MKEKLKHWFDRIHLPRGVVLVGDLVIIASVFVFVLLLRYSFTTILIDPRHVALQMAAGAPFFLLGAWLFRPYKGLIRHTAMHDVVVVIKAHLIGSLGLIFVSTVLSTYVPGLFIPNSVIIVHFFVSAMTLVAVRLFVQYMYRRITSERVAKMNIMIYGAGEVGLMAKTVIRADRRLQYNVVGFIDDNPALHGKTVRGVQIYPPDVAFGKIIPMKDVAEVVIAISPDFITKQRKREIVDRCLEHHVQVKAVPAPAHWINGQLRTDIIQRVRIEDLLGRPPIKIDNHEVSEGIRNRRVMVTGGAGSIGSEIVRQLCTFHPESIVLVDQAESALFDLQMELKVKFPDSPLFYEVADVTDRFRMDRILERYRPEIIYHASAYKHVPLMEDNPYEALRTNVGGTKNMADLAVAHGVLKFVMVSTDKAVNPTNVMGASKRLCELYVQSVAELDRPVTQFITTRFGNVLGSNGSVIPLFRKQIEKGGPVTITHREIIRYFMTIPEACQLVLEAGFLGKGGEIFLFDMGEPVKILDLAKKMISLSGLKPYEDIDIVETGLRPGEKLYEELLATRETTQPTPHEKIMVARIRPKDYRRSPPQDRGTPHGPRHRRRTRTGAPDEGDLAQVCVE
ncbi:NDP-sugar epimerase [Bacteroidales bacterium 6E]|nr:NDP-sugar epimerase [Bacteroidales bacterium 6E]